jgi:hypothetical protein
MLGHCMGQQTVQQPQVMRLSMPEMGKCKDMEAPLPGKKARDSWGTKDRAGNGPMGEKREGKGRATPLVTKVLCLTKLSPSHMQPSLNPSLTHSLTCLPAMLVFPNQFSPMIIFIPIAYRELRKHSFRDHIFLLHRHTPGAYLQVVGILFRWD